MQIGHFLTFSILEVRTNQAPVDAAPWFAPGGKWLVFDGRTVGGAEFTVGLKPEDRSPGQSFGFSDAMLIVKNRTAGRLFVDEFARAFEMLSPESGSDHPIVPLRLATSILGEGRSRSSTGTFSGSGGEWVASKWFVPKGDGDNAEIYFNYNLIEKQGEFSEKSRSEAPVLVRIFADVMK
jgi:hypothetical protein